MGNRWRGPKCNCHRVVRSLWRLISVPRPWHFHTKGALARGDRGLARRQEHRPEASECACQQQPHFFFGIARHDGAAEKPSSRSGKRSHKNGEVVIVMVKPRTHHTPAFGDRGLCRARTQEEFYTPVRWSCPKTAVPRKLLSTRSYCRQQSHVTTVFQEMLLLYRGY